VVTSYCRVWWREADAFATIYVLGRARSKGEADKAVARANDGEGVKKVTSYIDVRP
jgi:osmotically-inducible protein OsmY